MQHQLHMLLHRYGFQTFILLVLMLSLHALKVRFALCSSPVFSRTDLVTDSERFYNSLMEVLEDPAESIEVAVLLVWWNRYVVRAFLQVN